MHDLGASQIPDLVFAAALLLLAVLLLALGWSQPAARAFAAFVAVRGLSNIDGLFAGSHSAAFAEAVSIVDAVAELSIAFVAVSFLLVYPRPRPIARRPWVWAALWLPWAAALALLATRPGAYGILVPSAGGGFEMTQINWLHRVMDLQWAAYSLIAVTLALEFRGRNPGPARNGLLLVSTAWGLESIRVAIRSGFAALTRNEVGDSPHASFAVFKADLVLDAMGSLVVVAALVVLVRQLRKPAEPQKAAIRGALAAYAVSGLVAVFQIVDPWTLGRGLTPSGLANGLLRLAIPVAVAYALLRYQVFGLDTRVKWTLKQSTVAAIFVAAILAATESAQLLFGERRPWLGIAAAAVLIFALSPLQRFAERVSDAAMPTVRDTAEYRLARGREIYRAALESAALDGVVTEKERDVLAALQEQLGLKATEARGLERDVLKGRAIAADRPRDQALRG